MEVMKSFDHLFEEISADFLAECARAVHILVELTTHDWFLSDVCDGGLLPILLLHDRCLVKFVILHDVLVVELHCRLDLVFEQVHEPGVILGVAQIEHFQREFTAVVRVSKFDLGTEARSKCLGDVVVIKSGLDGFDCFNH